MIRQRLRSDWRYPITLAGMAYETFAICTGKVPTLSAVLYKLSTNPRTRVVTWTTLGYIAHHFLVEMNPSYVRVKVIRKETRVIS